MLCLYMRLMSIQVSQGFIIEPSQEGVEIELLEHKIALRIVPNAKFD